MTIALLGVATAMVLPIVATVVAGEIPHAEPTVRFSVSTRPSAPATPTPARTSASLVAPAASSTTALPLATATSPARTTSLSVVDHRPPSPVGRLRLVANTATTITIAWDPSTDNVGVVEYQVALNGTTVSTTQQTTLHVDGIPRHSRLLVQVAALDSARNQGEWRGLVLMPAPRAVAVPSGTGSHQPPAPSTSPAEPPPVTTGIPEPNPTTSDAPATAISTAPQTGDASSTVVPTVTLSPS